MTGNTGLQVGLSGPRRPGNSRRCTVTELVISDAPDRPTFLGQVPFQLIFIELSSCSTSAEKYLELGELLGGPWVLLSARNVEPRHGDL